MHKKIEMVIQILNIIKMSKCQDNIDFNNNDNFIQDSEINFNNEEDNVNTINLHLSLDNQLKIIDLIYSYIENEESDIFKKFLDEIRIDFDAEMDLRLFSKYLRKIGEKTEIILKRIKTKKGNKVVVQNTCCFINVFKFKQYRTEFINEYNKIQIDIELSNQIINYKFENFDNHMLFKIHCMLNLMFNHYSYTYKKFEESYSVVIINSLIYIYDSNEVNGEELIKIYKNIINCYTKVETNLINIPNVKLSKLETLNYLTEMEIDIDLYKQFVNNFKLDQSEYDESELQIVEPITEIINAIKDRSSIENITKVNSILKFNISEIPSICIIKSLIDNQNETRNIKHMKIENDKIKINVRDFILYYYRFYSRPIVKLENNKQILKSNIKVKEKIICDYVKDKFRNENISFNITLGNTRKRPDIRIAKQYYDILIEIDENQHKYYDDKIEDYRYTEIQDAFKTSLIVIRFNPDKHIDINGNSSSCFENKLLNIVELIKRLKVLELVISNYMQIYEPETNIKIIKLFYNNVIYDEVTQMIVNSIYQ